MNSILLSNVILCSAWNDTKKKFYDTKRKFLSPPTNILFHYHPNFQNMRIVHLYNSLFNSFSSQFRINSIKYSLSDLFLGGQKSSAFCAIFWNVQPRKKFNNPFIDFIWELSINCMGSTST